MVRARLVQAGGLALPIKDLDFSDLITIFSWVPWIPWQKIFRPFLSLALGALPLYPLRLTLHLVFSQHQQEGVFAGQFVIGLKTARLAAVAGVHVAMQQQ